MTVKDMLRPPYRFFKGLCYRGMERLAGIEMKLGARPMRPPRIRVQKAGEIRKILLPMMRYDYGIKERGLGYEYYNFYQTLVSMGYEVELFDFMSILQDVGRARMNSMLWDAVQSFKPDLAFFALFQEQFDKRVVRRISEETPAMTLNWFSDDEWRFHAFTRFWAPCFNFCTTTHKESLALYRGLGYQNAILTQWAANESIYRKIDVKKDIDVSFVGAPHGNRRAIVSALEGKGVHVECFGGGWPNGRLSQDGMVEVFNRSRINLNLSATSLLRGAQIKGRVFEVPMAGGLLFTDYASHLEDYFKPDEEMVVFKDLEDLAAKIRRHLSNPAESEAVAEAGYRRARSEHTYRARFEHIFSRMLGKPPGPPGP